MNLTAPENLEIGFVLSCAAIVFLMQAGFCLLESGLVRSKNSINVAVKNVLDCSVTMLLFISFGFAMMFGASWNGLIGDPLSSIDFTDPKLVSFLLFQLVFCSAAATIVSGAVAERIKLTSYIAIVLIVSGFVYPTFGHWAWGGTLPGTTQGWLNELGFIDWAGGSVVHVVGGFCALAAAQAVGKRASVATGGLTGGYSLTLAMLGVFLLWFSWWGFNGGSGLAVDGRLPGVILCTNLGAVAGGMTAAFYSWFKAGRIEVLPLIIGVLAGLVAVTAGCHVMSPGAAIVSGAVGSFLAITATAWLPKTGIDDAVSAFPVHGVAGLWGVVAVGIFAPESELLAGSRIQQITVQGIGVASAAALSYLTVLVGLNLLKMVMPIRVTEEEEKIGLNVVEHGATNAVTDLVMEIDGHARTGDFSTGLEADANTEVGQIAAGYNRVIQRVQSEISNHQETNRWLEEERLRMQTILDHAGVGIYQLDKEGKISSVNARLLELLGYNSLDAVVNAQSEQSETLFPWQKAGEQNSALLREQFDLGLPVKEIESIAVSRDGDELWVLESFVPIRDQAGNLRSWLGTMHNITVQKQAAIAEIEIAKAKSDAKGEFLASMSHEIRTPLNGVIGMLDLLDSSDIKAKEKNFVSIAKNSAGTLLSLINDILDFSKIESGHMELESIDYNVIDLVEEIAEQFAYHAHVKSLDLNCEISSDMPKILIGDPERLRQVVVNLLGNAIKFTEEGEINLSVSRRGSVMRVSVQDTGIGMDEATQEKLFDSFTQADASTTRKYGGTGLGLTISSKLIDLMGGRIRVNSEPGAGSEFWFEIEMQIDDAEPKLADNASKLMHKLPDARVLVVDDNTTNCEILANQFNNWGLNVSVCKESTRVIDRMLVAGRIGKPFDLIILDFCMPEMDGRDVAIAIQNEASIAGVPIILLSSNFELLSKQELASLGIFSAITKPARQSRLLDTVMNALSKEPSRIAPPEVDDQPSRPSPDSMPFTRGLSNRVEPMAAMETAETATPSVAAKHDKRDEPSERTADILIVEDNHVNRIVAEKMLAELGLSTDFACNGKEGVEKATSSTYGMVLMDGHMPVMDGLEATREIRKWESEQAGGKHVPIVALTANVVQGIRRECADAGMDHYLCKPITMPAMRTAVEKYLPGFVEKVSREAKPLSSLGKEGSQTPVVEQNVLQPSEPPQTEAPKVTQKPPTPAATTAPLATNRESASEESFLSPKRRASDQFEQESVPVEEVNENLFSLETLREQFGGDDAFARQILDVMRETLPKQIEEVQAASIRNDYQQVASIAHQIKGAAGDSCLTAVFEAASKLEKHAMDQDASSVPLTVAMLARRSLETVDLIETLINLD